MQTLIPSRELLKQVRTHFIMKDTTLTQWCRKQGVNPSNAREALMGTWDGPKGRALRARILKAAGVRAAA